MSRRGLCLGRIQFLMSSSYLQGLVHRQLCCWPTEKMTHMNNQHIGILNISSITSQCFLSFSTWYNMFRHAWPSSGVKIIKYLGEIYVGE